NATNEICASDATLVGAGRSVSCAAADIASGKITEVPIPISAKPTSASQPLGAKKTSRTPAPSTPSRTRATAVGEYRSTNGSAKNRVTACAQAPSATAKPERNGDAPNTSRM